MNIYDINTKTPIIERTEINNKKYVNVITNSTFNYFKDHILDGIGLANDESILWNGISVDQLKELSNLNCSVLSCSVSKIDLSSIEKISGIKIILYLCFIDNSNGEIIVLTDTVPLDSRDILDIPFTNKLNEYINHKNPKNF